MSDRSMGMRSVGERGWWLGSPWIVGPNNIVGKVLEAFEEVKCLHGRGRTIVTILGMHRGVACF